MKFASIFVLAAFLGDASATEVQTEVQYDPMEGYTCPPGPKSGWASRGDESCKYIAPPLPVIETVGGLEIGKCYQFSSKNLGGKAFRHRGGEVWLDQKHNQNALYRADATWKVVKGLKGDADTVSLQASNFPSFHLRHSNFLTFAQPGAGAPYNADASFKIVQSGPHVQFESVNLAGHMLRHTMERVKLNQDDGTPLFANDSKFVPSQMPC